jgi:hypothetical protein
VPTIAASEPALEQRHYTSPVTRIERSYVRVVAVWVVVLAALYAFQELFS